MKISDLRVLPAIRLLVVLALAGCVHAPAPAVQHVYIVRHAEKVSGDDPALSAAGTARAAALAALLQDRGIGRIFSTDTRRTRSTAMPLAERLGLEIEIYDHRRPDALAAKVRAAGQNALIVGHSNTIAGLAEAFGAQPGAAVADDEYDRLYVIRLTEDDVTSEIRRYAPAGK